MTKKIWPLFALTLTFSCSNFAATSVVPSGNGTWIYDMQYTVDGKKIFPVAGSFIADISAYNRSTTAPHQITQVFTYGGDLELNCAGSGGTSTSTPCSPSSFFMPFYPPSTYSTRLNNWEAWENNLGDSGFASAEAYTNLPGVKQSIVIIDGQVNAVKGGGEDSLDHLNTLSQTDAKHFANIVAKAICANDGIDGVQFDVEPFSFTGRNGTYPGPGQQYFFQEIAKDFAGFYGYANDPAGINKTTKDRLRCVDEKHPNGRIFSVFAGSGAITPTVVSTLTLHGNGYVIDSLYDLDSTPGGTYTSPQKFKQLITAEIANMDSKNVPYQLAIPAAASVHEFETISNGTRGAGAGNQILYVQNALQTITPYRSRPNFKGIAIWSFQPAMWWHGLKFTPAKPQANVLSYLRNNL